MLKIISLKEKVCAIDIVSKVAGSKPQNQLKMSWVAESFKVSTKTIFFFFTKSQFLDVFE